MLWADLGDWARQAVGGSMLLAVPVAMAAGLVSFFSPCVLPLLPGYLSYATGLRASELADRATVARRGRVLAGTLLFVGGFALVFVSGGLLLGALGSLLREWQVVIRSVVGVLAVGLGLIFTGWLPVAQQSARLQVAPRMGLAAAPLLGIVFGLGWTPCIGPALSVVLNLAISEGTALRGGILACAYALGLGLPFVLAGLAFSRIGRGLDWIRRHHRGVQIAGGLLLMTVGVSLITGWWDVAMAMLRQWVSAFGTVI